MIDRDDVNALFAEVKSNRARLEACPAHNFGRLPRNMTRPRRLKCSRCLGQMDISDILEYRAGYKAAGGNPHDVLDLEDK